MATLNETAAPVRTWPGPRGRWLTGCMGPIRKDPLGFYHEAWRTYGDHVRIRVIPGYPVFLLTDPVAAEHVLSKNHKNYRKSEVVNGPLRLLAGNGILTSEGEFWLRQRRLVQPAFLRGRMEQLGGFVSAAAEALVRQWEQAEDGRALDVLPEMMRLGLRIASTSLFGTDISADADSIGHAYRVAFDHVNRKMNDPFLLPLWVPTRHNREVRRSTALLDRVVIGLIESRRRAGPAANDVLDMLLAARDEAGAGMTDRQLKDEVITILTAGHETVGAALSWAWYLLGGHQGVQESLHDEAAGHLRGRTPTAADLPRLPLATAVFEEAMRLYPPAWGLARQAVEADEINGYPLPRKALVMLSQWITHRHPAFWSDPDRFDPSRFLPVPETRPKFAYFPFGGGPRMCIGNHFAMVEGPLVLAAMAQRFRLELIPGQEVVPDPTFTLRPRDGVKVVVRRRQEAR